MKIQATGIKVELKKAEEIRKLLSLKKLLRDDLKITKDGKFIYFPVKDFPNELSSYAVEKKEFEEIKKKYKSYKEILKIPDEIKNKLPTSYDVIGHIILIKLSENIQNFQHEIGEALIKANKNIKSVYKIEPVKGEFRTRKIKLLSGVNNSSTIHKEFDLSFNLDVQKTYFSPRLANERKRVSELVKNDEIVVDMFTGVAPFSIMIAKYASPKIIYAIDKNKDAIDYAKQNILKNNVLDKIELIHDDAKNVSKIVRSKADRIIMNLPFSSYSFFKYALEIAKNNCIIHYYDILEENKIQNRIDELKKIAKENGFSLDKLDIRKIKSYTPREFYIGIDITAKKNADVA